MLRAVIALMLACLAPFAAAQAERLNKPGHYLFVWTQDRAKEGMDFLAVIDADPASPSYGKLITSTATDQKSNNAHHTEYEMPAGGMLFANDHNANRTIIFDLNDPLKPRPAASFESLGGFSMPHSFLRLPNGNVLASFQYPDHHGHMDMAGKSGGLVEIDNQGKLVRAVSNADPAFSDEGLLPYSIAILPKIDRVLLTNSPMGDDFLFTSNTYQMFRLSDLKLLGTYRLDPGAKMSGHISPEEARVGPDGAVYVQTLSCGIQRVTGMESAKPSATLVHQFPGAFCGVPTIISHYLVQSVPGIHGYIVLDIADGAKPREVSWLTINEKYSPHWTGWDPISRRVVVTSAEQGDRTYLLKLDEKTGALTIDEKFRGDDGQAGFSFAKRIWPHGWTGEGRPHGAVFSR
jgi:hypothetical protein